MILIKKHLLKFVEDNEKLDETSPMSLSYDEYLDMTVNGNMRFDAQHPYSKDQRFISDLIHRYAVKENYEMCKKIVNMGKKKKH